MSFKGHPKIEDSRSEDKVEPIVRNQNFKRKSKFTNRKIQKFRKISEKSLVPIKGLIL